MPNAIATIPTRSPARDESFLFGIRIAVLLTGIAFATLAQTQQTLGREHLTVECYWQNTEALVFYRLSKDQWSDWSGCEKYADPTHCQRTAVAMFYDAKHDWERVTADGSIYTIRCKQNCKRFPVASQSYDAETDGKLMWITFESPDNKNWVETFEIFDTSPMKEESASAIQEPTAPTQPAKPAAAESTTKVGTGFFVSEEGHILTNAHVVSGCKLIRTRDGRTANLVNEDDKIDLALLQVVGESGAVATFRLRPEPRIGDSVIAFGYPLQGVLSSEGNLSTGTVSATAGLGDDPRFMQFSAPIQPGNSGSPLLDSGGDVIGVIESKLDAVETLKVAGDIPQNVNFAIRAVEAIEFLERNHVSYHVEVTGSTPELKVPDVASSAKQFSIPIECTE